MKSHWAVEVPPSDLMTYEITDKIEPLTITSAFSSVALLLYKVAKKSRKLICGYKQQTRYTTI